MTVGGLTSNEPVCFDIIMKCKRKYWQPEWAYPLIHHCQSFPSDLLTLFLELSPHIRWARIGKCPCKQNIFEKNHFIIYLSWMDLLSPVGTHSIDANNVKVQFEITAEGLNTGSLQRKFPLYGV